MNELNEIDWKHLEDCMDRAAKSTIGDPKYWRSLKVLNEKIIEVRPLYNSFRRLIDSTGIAKGL